MPFFDEASYSLSLRHRHTLSSSFTCGLVFSPSTSHLAALSTTGRLTVTPLSASSFSSSSASASTPAAPPSSWRPFVLPTVARALAAGRRALYVAGDFGIVATGWQRENSTPVVQHVAVDALCTVTGAIVGLVNSAYILVVDDSDPRPCAMLPADVNLTCLASLPSGTAFLAGCIDGTIRQYDLRRARTPVRICKLSTSPVTALVADPDGTFALCGDASHHLHTAHLHSATPVASVPVPFLPRAAAFAGGHFYVGGSDRQPTKERDLLRVDFQCCVKGSTPVSAKSVYALVAEPKTGAMAAAGYCPEKTSRSWPAELVDVYVHPPVRSISFEV